MVLTIDRRNIITYFIAISADGVYQASAFQETISEEDTGAYLKKVYWDPSYWLNLAVTDVKDGKIGTSKKYSQFHRENKQILRCTEQGEG